MTCTHGEVHAWCEIVNTANNGGYICIFSAREYWFSSSVTKKRVTKLSMIVSAIISS
jgi:hypothetical protein